LERAPAAVDAALVALAYLAASPVLQAALLESNVLPYLVPLLLQYDVTLSPEASARLQLPFSSAAGAGQQQQQQQQQQPVAEAAFRLLDSGLVRPNMQEARSQHALLAAQALARIAGARAGRARACVYVCVCGCVGVLTLPFVCPRC
jgi:DnaJ family protein C protein 13